MPLPGQATTDIVDKAVKVVCYSLYPISLCHVYIFFRVSCLAMLNAVFVTIIYTTIYDDSVAAAGRAVGCLFLVRGSTRGVFLI